MTASWRCSAARPAGRSRWRTSTLDSTTSTASAATATGSLSDRCHPVRRAPSSEMAWSAGRCCAATMLQPRRRSALKPTRTAAACFLDEPARRPRAVGAGCRCWESGVGCRVSGVGCISQRQRKPRAADHLIARSWDAPPFSHRTPAVEVAALRALVIVDERRPPSIQCKSFTPFTEKPNVKQPRRRVPCHCPCRTPCRTPCHLGRRDPNGRLRRRASGDGCGSCRQQG